MFEITILKDTIPIHPSDFGLPPEQALIAELNKKYANRVLHGVGLCVCTFDITEAGEGKVRYGDGFLWYKVIFRMVVFRPFPSEIILAKVKSVDAEGMRLTLGFFDDVYVPSAYLPAPSAFDISRRQHFWVPPGDEEDPLTFWT
ncbi:DNA-directed RNA polymerase III complex subunit Rpc25 [Pleurotus ostreatus]|nr:DNA-directed RNA polymerase III complex subunit Rpc25 [Pleurotus ostreatus]